LRESITGARSGRSFGIAAYVSRVAPRLLEETHRRPRSSTVRGIAAATRRIMTNPFETIDTTDLNRVQGGMSGQLSSAMHRAQELGLRVTSTTGGRHAPRSYHYQGRAIDVAGPASAMRTFYREMAGTNPTELFYDPMGGIKHGRNIGAIGGHGTHVHIAY
jgi:hypothetical protein